VRGLTRSVGRLCADDTPLACHARAAGYRNNLR